MLLIFATAESCTRSYPVGELSARVMDANDAPVGGVAADLFKITPSGQVYWRASRTGIHGIAVFGKGQGVIEGEYVVRISLMPWQKLGPGELNNRHVKLKRGDLTVVTFRVVPSLRGRPTPR